MDAIQSKLRAAGVEVDQEELGLLSEMESSGHLSIGWPDSAYKSDWLVWFPRSVPDKRTTAIVSSRLGRKLDGIDCIFRVIRSALVQLDPRRQCVLSAEGTTTHPYITRACELFGIPLLHVKLARPRQSLASWARAALKDGTKAGRTYCFVSNSTKQSTSKAPIRDFVEVMESDQLLVLHARPAGNLHGLLLERLQGSERPRVFLAVGSDQLVPKALASEFMEKGAVGWFLNKSESDQHVFPIDENRPPLSSRILTSLENQDSYFTHCTRRSAGAWPDQRKEDFLDELILGGGAKDRSSLAALMRIIGRQTLIATSTSVRGERPVVSFTAAPLDRLSELRTFRSHRGRWDFEPYGISIDRTTLTRHGAREVIYGDENVWEQLSKIDRPFYQKVGTNQNSIDWRVEQEWRVLGDIDLSLIPSTKAVVFVPTVNEAKHVAQICRWPVVVVDK